MDNRKKPPDEIIYHYHPALRVAPKNLFSFKNLKDFRECANVAVGFLAPLAFLERHNFGGFQEDSFLLCENLFPVIDISKFKPGKEKCGSAIPQLMANIFFKDKEASRGRIPKSFCETLLWVRNLQKRKNITAKKAVAEIIDVLNSDNIKITLQPLWSVGIEWRPTDELLSGKNQIFSANNEVFFKILINWAENSSWTVLNAESELPYPYASLEPVIKHFFKEKDSAKTFLKDNFSKGSCIIAEKLKELLEQRNERFLIWAKNSDEESLKIIEKVVEKTSASVMLCSRKGSQLPLTIKEVNFLFLHEEGEKWFKENALFSGFENEEELCKFVSKKDPMRFSPYESLFIESHKTEKNEKRIKSNYPASIILFLKAAFIKNQIEKDKIFIRSLIESGQVVLAIEKIDEIRETDDELSFLKLWAKSQLKDFNYVLKEKDKIKNISNDDFFSLSLFYSEALWLSGKTDKAKEELGNLLVKSKNSEERFRVLSQFFLLHLNCGEIKDADRTLSEMKAIVKDDNFKQQILLNHHIAALEKSKNDFKKALSYFIESAEWARKGGFRLHETLLNIEIGNCFRLIGEFDESLNYLRKASFQAWVLRHREAEKQARFDIMISEIEKGNLFKAQEEITNLIESRNKKIPLVENAIEQYWLSYILFLRGELIKALEIVEAPLKAESKMLPKELYFSLNILRGNILWTMNESKSLQILLKRLKEEDIFSFGPELTLEYFSLLNLAASKKIASLSEKDIIMAKKAFEKSSSLTQITYLLSKARLNDADSFKSAKEAYEMAKKSNSVLAKTQAIFLLYKMNRLPIIPEEELKEIEIFIKENKIQSEICELLRICEERKTDVNVEENLITFLHKASSLRVEETLPKFLKLSNLDGVAVFTGNQNLSSIGALPKKEDILSLLGKETEKKMGDLFIFTTSSKDGLWGIISSKSNINQNQKEIFSIYINLQSPCYEVKEEKGTEDFGIIDKILIGVSPRIIEVKRKIAEAAQFNYPILITGEAGSGKEVCAKSIHLSSSRAKKEWVAFNCANLTPTLAASQLFGHKKGSFTGADSDKEGLVATAKDSTLFLDEIGEIPLETQAHFLRFLQDGSYQPLGSNFTLNSNARIIAATNKNLEKEAREGRFREDLYYRLKVITIEMPPLRERKEDIIPLFEKFLEEECEKEKIIKPFVKKGVYLKLVSHNWFGNVRELQNFVKRAIVSSIRNGTIDEKNVIFEKGTGGFRMTLKQQLENYEKDLIEGILKRNSNNISESSKEAGLSRQAFCQRAKKLGLIK